MCKTMPHTILWTHFTVVLQAFARQGDVVAWRRVMTGLESTKLSLATMSSELASALAAALAAKGHSAESERLLQLHRAATLQAKGGVPAAASAGRKGVTVTVQDVLQRAFHKND